MNKRIFLLFIVTAFVLMGANAAKVVKTILR